MAILVMFPSSAGAQGVPDAPTGAVAVAGVEEATVSWTAPADNGSVITSYTVTSSPAGKICMWSTGPLSCTVVSLDTDTDYTFVVTATNGAGPASAPSPAITPLSGGSLTPSPAATPTPTQTPTPTVAAIAEASVSPSPSLAPTNTPTGNNDAPVIQVDLDFGVGDQIGGASFSAEGAGMAPNTFVSVSIASVPTVLGSSTVASDGTFEMIGVPLPTDLAVGEHALILAATAEGGTAVEYLVVLSVDAAGVLTDVDAVGFTAARATSLPATGATMWPTVMAALLLLLVGVALVQAQPLLSPGWVGEADMGSPLDPSPEFVARLCAERDESLTGHASQPGEPICDSTSSAQAT